MALWENWLGLALLTAGAWAASCIIDVCFVGVRLFRRPGDACVITGLFCLVPLVLLMPSAAFQMRYADPVPALCAMLAGTAYLLHVYFYFRALFLVNDASSAEVFNSLCVLFVPLLAFVLLGERLPQHQYLALGLAVVGVAVLVGRQLDGASARVVIQLAASVTCMSVAMVLQARAYERLDFATGTSWFLLAAFVAALTLTLCNASRRRRVGTLCTRFGPVFVVVELIEVAAVIGSQRATDIAPSVSLVALAECALPVFVICFSALILLLARGRLPQRVGATLAMQTRAWGTKVLSIALIGSAIVLVAP